MYPLGRLWNTTRKAHKATKGGERLALDAVGEITFRCRPWDLDMFMEMNNGRVLTLYDLGRFDLSIRSGLWDTLRAQRWGLAVAGSSVRYRKRVRPVRSGPHAHPDGRHGRTLALYRPIDVGAGGTNLFGTSAHMHHGQWALGAHCGRACGNRCARLCLAGAGLG